MFDEVIKVFSDINKIYAAASRLATDAVESQIEEARAEIARQQRKIRNWNAQKKFFKALMVELSKPPKPFKPPKMTRKQRKELERMQRLAYTSPVRGAIAVPVSPMKQ